ncbi:MAG: hypothetical protein J0H08_03770 [Rhizobiales bacterium]|nr:hypothetical protein [Hyphomicrobiales bacterium]
MPPQPFLLFPKSATTAKRGDLPLAFPPKVQIPSAGRQKERLEQKFKDVVAAFDDIKTDAEGFEPERVIVFETRADKVTEFAKAAAKVEGLEWVGELDLGDLPGDADFRVVDPDKQHQLLTARLYAVMGNQKGAQNLLSLWNNWQKEPDKRAASGFGPFKDVFAHLKEIRRWSPRDRLEGTGLLADWEAQQQWAAARPGMKLPPVRFEVELWYRADIAGQSKAYNQLNAIVTRAQGRCITSCTIGEIFYHGVLAELPAAAVSQTLAAIQVEQFTELLRCEAVMFFRPRAQALFPLAELGEETVTDSRGVHGVRIDEPLVAVLDGLPLENHSLLRDRVTIDDPDQLQEQYAQPGHQQHGTAMCSLILNGDLSKQERPLASARSSSHTLTGMETT